MDAGVAALLGALLGGGATVLANFVQTGAMRRRDRVKTAAELAIVEYEREIALAKVRKEQDEVAPLAQYVAFHREVLSELERNTLTVKQITELAKKYEVYFQ